tara:strand:- start:1002 stop:1658 length:657 start_codon:yes stop_codon:yes gene_type:complete
MPRTASGGVAGLLALLSGGTFWFAVPPEDALLSDLPVVRVNADDRLMAHWASEDVGADAGAPPECEWWQMNETYADELCSHFTIGRLSTTPALARTRAQRCAAAAGAECVLSPEVGLGVPAAFLNDHASGAMLMLLAPRFLALEGGRSAALQHVRVSAPDGDGMIGTRTFKFNKTVNIEYFDGVTKAMHVREFEGDDAYCAQMLRAAFAPSCWMKLEA